MPTIEWLSLMKLQTFTTRPDTLYGVTFLIVAPEHPIVSELTTFEQKAEVEEYIQKTKAKSDRERQINKEKTGVFTGSYVKHPLTGEKIPVWIADYVLYGYGSGAIMAVPAHDERDFEFAQKYDLPIKRVVNPKQQENVLLVHGSPYTEPVNENIADKFWFGWVKNKLVDSGYQVFNPEMPNSFAPDYETYKQTVENSGFDLHRYSTLVGHSTGAAFACRYLMEKKIRIDKLILVAPGYQKTDENPALHGLYDFELNKKLNNYVGHIKILISKEDMPHIVESAKIYAKKLGAEIVWFENRGHFFDTEFQELFELILEPYQAFIEKGQAINSGLIDKLDTDSAKSTIIKHLSEQNLGSKQVNYKFRDWVFSRQRYWGEPFPFRYENKQ